MGYPYPIHDWLDESHYRSLSDLTKAGWAWEFLRRNAEYQRLWDEFDALPDHMTLPDGTLSNKNGKWRGTPWMGFRFGEDGACWTADPEPHRGESEGDYERRTDGMGAVMPFADFLRRRFGLAEHSDLPCPRSRDPGCVAFGDDESRPPWEPDLCPPNRGNERFLPPSFLRDEKHAWEDRMAHYGQWGFATLTFDLRRDIPAQLDAAKAYLEERQQNFIPTAERIKPRNASDPEVFARYLRMLDASAAAAKIRDMDRRIFEPIGISFDACKAALKEARRLRDGGYLDLGSRG